MQKPIFAISGHTCIKKQVGKYQCPRCDETITMKYHARYPNCSTSGVVVRWELIQPPAAPPEAHPKTPPEAQSASQKKPKSPKAKPAS
jgi:hypothetical protein